MRIAPFLQLILTSAALILGEAAIGQEPFFRRHLLGEALEKAKVTLVYEAPDGFLWFGSDKGLLQYNGIEFKNFKTPDSLGNNEVSAIFQDRRGRLWAGYRDGSILYKNNRDELQRWQPEEGVPAVAITGIAEDARGVLWIATYGEGIYYQDQNRLYNINTDDGLASNDIYVLSRDKSGQMWLGTDNGISICKLVNGKKQVRNISKSDGLPDEIVRDIVHDAKGNCWIGTNNNGFCYYEVRTKTFSCPAKSTEVGVINKLALFENRDLWIATEGNGLWRYDLQEAHLERVSGNGKKLQNAKVYDLHRDIEGNLWVVNNVEGICSANRRFSYLSTPFDNTQAFLVDAKKRLWVGTQEGVFVRNKLENEQFVKINALPANTNVVSLYEDRYGNIWIGTFNNAGVYCYHPESKKLINIHEKEGLTNSNVLSIAGIGNQLWLATLGGVTEITLHGNPFNGGMSFENLNHENGLGTNFIYKTFIDSRGRTWFGADGKGISVLENGKITNYSHADDIKLRSVYSITEDQQGHIWLSTDKEGIFEFDGQHFTRLSVKEGLRNMAIMGLSATARGDILILHASGVDILEPATKHLIYYDDEVGISKAEPNLNALCSDNQRNIWMGFGNQIVRYSTLNDTLAIHPRTLLTSVSASLQPIDFRTQQFFAHDENNIVFEYTGLWYTNPAAVRYRYKLEGFSHDWVLSADRRAVYPNLPPGEYTFVVSSTENTVFDNEPEVRYHFTVLAPFWQRWWFIVLTTTIAALSIRYFVQLRDKQLQQASLLKKEKIESQYEALKSQINPHFLFNSFNTLITLIEEDSALAVAYVETLSDFYRSILQYREKEVIPLEEELELVRNYTFLLKKRYGDNFQLRIECNAQSMETVWLPPLTLQMLVENAVKHNVIGKSKVLEVRISISEDGHYLLICNNIQRKMTAEKSTGFGLQSIARRYELLTDSKIIVEEIEGVFRVQIPLIKNGRYESLDRRG